MPAPDSRMGWRVASEPALSIGTLDGEGAEQFFFVMDATRLADGTILVANSGTSEVRRFSADGNHLGTWGGVGEGPGEFAQFDPDAVGGWPGDSIIVSGWTRGEVAVFDSAGNHGRTTSLGDGHFAFVGPLPDGSILAKPSLLIGMSFMAEGGSLRRQAAEFGIISAEGGLSVSLGTHPGDEWWWYSGGARPHPFGRSVFATTWGPTAVVATNDRYEINAYRLDGALTRIIRRDHELRVPTRAELNVALEESYADFSEEERDRLSALTEDMELVEFFPAFAALRSDPLGYLWVQEYGPPGQGDNLWTVFDPEGRVQGFVEMPTGLTVFEIGADYVLGLARGEMDVESVQLWPLTRG